MRYRTLVVPPGVLESLREWKVHCPKGRLDLVFPSKKGTVAYYSSVIKSSVLPTMKRAGLMVDKGKVNRHGTRVLSPKYGGLHAFRHFFASWCINRKEDGGLGLHVKQVQERMGHANVQITMDTYGHLFPIPNEADALGKGEAILRRNKNAASDHS
ncbi:MAG: tyrosine-type recombinase/integrase [Rhizobiaceae bacterium]